VNPFLFAPLKQLDLDVSEQYEAYVSFSYYKQIENPLVKQSQHS